MCGRLNVTEDPLTQLLMDAFGLAGTPVTNQNLAPTENVLVVRAKDVSAPGIYTADEMRWWLTPSWSSKPGTKYAMFNAKSETLAEKRAFARPFRSLAGIWDSWTDRETGEVLESCSVITAAAHDSLAFLHHRQPVFLTAAEATAWLAGDATPQQLGVLFEPHLPGALLVDPVSSYVNNARNKGERCVQPIAQSYLVDGKTENLVTTESLVTKETSLESAPLVPTTAPTTAPATVKNDTASRTRDLFDPD